MSNTLHLIWIGGTFRDEEIDSVRAILTAAYVRKVPIEFIVDNQSINSVTRVLNGLNGTSSKLKDYNLDPSFNFLKSNAVRFVNIDTDLDSYLDDFIDAPAIQTALTNLFGPHEKREIKELLCKIIQLERTGSYKNLASVSDILRTIALIKNGGYYRDSDVRLKRDPNTLSVAGDLPIPNTFKINMQAPHYAINNDIIAANPYNPEYIDIFSHIISRYMLYLGQDNFFYKADKLNAPDVFGQSGYSFYTHKRQLLRFNETHRTTGNLHIGYFFRHRNMYKIEHTLSGTVFNDAESLSTISWMEPKHQVSDDTSIDLKVASNNLSYAKEMTFFMKRIKTFYNPKEYTLSFVKRLAYLMKTAELINLVRIQPDEMKHLLSALVLEVHQDFYLLINGLILRYNEPEKSGILLIFMHEPFIKLWCVTVVENAFKFELVNDDAKVALLSMLSCLNDLNDTIIDKNAYENEHWKFVADAFEWYKIHLDPKIKARAYVSRNLYYGYSCPQYSFNKKMFSEVYLDDPAHYTFISEQARTLFLYSFIKYDTDESYIDTFRQLAADSNELEAVRDYSISLNRTKYIEQFEEEEQDNGLAISL